MAKGIYVGVKSTLDPTQDSFKIVGSSKQDFVDRKIIVPGGVGGSKYWDTTNMTSSTFYPNEAVDFASSTIWPSSFNFSNKFFLFSNDLTHLYEITSVSNKTEISTRALDPGSSVEITASGSVYDIAGISSVARKVKKMYVGVDTQVPIMSETTQQLTLNDTNLKEFFDVSAETGTNKWTPLNITGGGVSFSPGNYGVNSTTATCTLTAKENLTNIVIGYSYVTEKSYDKVTIVRNGSTLLNAASGSNTGTFDATTLAKGQTIKLTYTKDSSQSASGEKVNIDITCDPIEKTVQTITGYEMQEIARKIKKGYVGVGGVARPFFSGGGLPTYYGHVTNPSTARFNMSGVTIGNKAVFAGGVESSSYHGSTASRAIDVYDSSLALTTSYLGTAKQCMAGIGTKDGWALLAGGKTRGVDSQTCTDVVQKLDASLALTTAASGLAYGLYDAGAGTVGGYALVAGGHTNTSSGQRPEVYAYDSALTRLQVSSLKANNSQVSGCSLDNMVIFAGGVTETNVVAYNASLTQTVSSQTYYQRHPAAAPLGEKAIFAGGVDSNNSYQSAVYVCDSSLTVTAASQSLTKANAPAGIAFDGYVAFGYGYTGSTMSPWRCDIFDESMTMTHIDDGDSHGNLVQSASEIVSAAKAGNYAIFAGTFVSYTHALFQD